MVGTCTTRFSSAPDGFALSQSWGWKSTSLAAALSPVNSSGDGERTGEGVFSSVRVCLVLGLV